MAHCIPQSCAHKTLIATLCKLRQEKEALEAKLNGDDCEVDPSERRLDAAKEELAQMKARLLGLQQTIKNIEAEMKRLQERVVENSKAVDVLRVQVEEQKKSMREAIEEATNAIKDATLARISAQEKFAIDQQEAQQQQASACQMAAAAAAAQSQNQAYDEGQGYEYPYDATVERPARYVRQHMRQNPPRVVPFPNAAMEEAERLGHEGPSCPYNR